MVRQYKIHTNMDGLDNRVFDVTNGKLRLYSPSNLGIQISNAIWSADGIGVKGSSNISQPDITFNVETFGSNLSENYELLTDFVQAVMAQKFVTLEYETDNFKVYADLAMSEQSKTEGYGRNGTFSEQITFQPITKWYTYEQLIFSTIDNGTFDRSYSKIYGLTVPPTNLLKGTKNPVSRTGNNITNQREFLYSFDNGKTFAEQGFNVGDKLAISFNYSLSNPSTGVLSIQFNDTPWTIPGASKTISSTTSNGHVFTTFEITSSNINSSATGVELKLDNIPTSNGVTISNLTMKVSNTELPWSGSASEEGGYVYSSKPSYTYFGETNVQRFSKWVIEDGIFSFTAVLTPSVIVPNDNKYGLRFLDSNFNEYTAIVFNSQVKPTAFEINTDVNDEFYAAYIGENVINQFPNLDFARYRTRQFQRGTMELIGISQVDMKVKKKVDFI